MRYITPVQSKLRRLSLRPQGNVSKEIKLERQGDVERVDASQWVSPTAIVKRPDRAIHVCVSTSVHLTRRSSSTLPLPHIEELLNSMQGASHFSKLDLASAHQVELDPESRILTAVNAYEGLFRFKRVFSPGLCTSHFSASNVKDFERLSWRPVLPGRHYCV